MLLSINWLTFGVIDFEKAGQPVLELPLKIFPKEVSDSLPSFFRIRTRFSRSYDQFELYHSVRVFSFFPVRSFEDAEELSIDSPYQCNDRL